MVDKMKKLLVNWKDSATHFLKILFFFAIKIILML
jgi:hypothetical protein